MVAKTDPDAVYQVEMGLFVRDYEASLRFYRDLIGCEVWGEIPLRQGGLNSHIWGLRFGNANIKISHSFEEAPDPPSADRRIVFRVSNLDEIVAQCGEAGVPVLEVPTDLPNGVRYAVVSDPDGYLVEFCQGSPWHELA